jgi:hypothetical protein
MYVSIKKDYLDNGSAGQLADCGCFRLIITQIHNWCIILSGSLTSILARTCT